MIDDLRKAENSDECAALPIQDISGSTCPKCGCCDYEEWQEQEYENGGDDPMYGGKLIWVKMTRCGNCD